RPRGGLADRWRTPAAGNRPLVRPAERSSSPSTPWRPLACKIYHARYAAHESNLAPLPAACCAAAGLAHDDRAADRDAGEAIGTALVDGDLGEAVGVLVPEGRALRHIAE